MLITCAECNHQVSSHAASCPNCGAPVGGNPGRPLATIQQTSKALKGQILAAVCMMLLGIGACCVSGPYEQAGGIGVLLAVGGLIWWIILRVEVWWHHG